MGAQLSAISGNKRRGLLEALYNTTPTGRTLGSAVGSSGPARASRTGRRLAVGAVHDSAELLEGTRRGGRAMPLGYPHHARGLSWTDVGRVGPGLAVCQTTQTNKPLAALRYMQGFLPEKQPGHLNTTLLFDKIRADSPNAARRPNWRNLGISVGTGTGHRRARPSLRVHLPDKNNQRGGVPLVSYADRRRHRIPIPPQPRVHPPGTPSNPMPAHTRPSPHRPLLRRPFKKPKSSP